MEFDKIVSDETIQATINAFEPRGFTGHVVNTKSEALELIKSLIPEGSSVMNGASETLENIGYIDYLKSGTHSWNNLHETIVNETDPVKQSVLRRNATTSDFYLGSVHALAQTGEMIIASNTGSQLPNIVYSSPNVIFVVGAQKIVPSLEIGMERLHQHVMPLENERMLKAYGSGTYESKTFLFHREPAFTRRNIHVIIVKESLGF